MHHEPNLLMKVETILRNGFSEAQVRVADLTGTQDHLEVWIESKDFAGLKLLQQHRKVMDLLAEEFSDRLHAIKINTKIPEGDQDE